MKPRRAFADRLLILGLLAVLFPTGALAEEKTRNQGDQEGGRLDAFEEEATREKPRHEHQKGECADDDDDEDDVFFHFFEATLYSFLYGGIGSLERVSPTGLPEAAATFSPRRLGEPMIPFLSLELSSQYASPVVEATDFRVEAGFGPLAAQIRHTRYKEQFPRDTMSLHTIHGLYRMTFADPVELDLGLGTTYLIGNRAHSGFSLTLPIRIQPTPNLGAEFRPAWSWLGGSTLHDYQVHLVIRASVISIRGGYRWVSTGEIELSGPLVGLGFQL